MCGAGGTIQLEPMVVEREFLAQWTKGLNADDLAELARLRFIEGWTRKRLQMRFGYGRSYISARLRELRNRRELAKQTE